MSKGNINLSIVLVLGLCLGLYLPNLVYAIGLSTGFSEVTLENLEIGRIYSTEGTAGLPLVVVNTGKESIDLKMELLMPEVSELKEGFAPIPDLGWIKLETLEFKHIKPNETATTDVIISIPDDKQYCGKKYQVFIWSHTVGRKVGVGLKSKLLFTIKEK